jgi:hypothetical protein
MTLIRAATVGYISVFSPRLWKITQKIFLKFQNINSILPTHILFCFVTAVNTFLLSYMYLLDFMRCAFIGSVSFLNLDGT